MKLLRAVPGLMLAVPLLSVSPTVLAVGVTAGTNVTNTATLSYSVSGNPQPDVNSNTAAFVVDNRLDLSVSLQDVARVVVAPGETGAVLTYQVTNTGNQPQDFSLSAANNATDPFGGVENFDPSSFSVFVESGVTPGFQPLEDTATYIDELANDGSATVYLVASIPAGRADGDIAALTLTAQVAVGGSAGAQGADITTDDSALPDDPATVQTVFGDAAGDTDAATDGRYSDSGAYQVAAAVLNISKTATVIWDPINDTSNPKAIPGAAVRYSITVSNDPGAAVSATLTQISDALDANSAFDADLSTDNSGTPLSAAGNGFRVTQVSARPSTPATQDFTTVSGDDAAEHDGSATGGNLQVDLTQALPAEVGYTAGELRPGESVTISFQVIVQ